MLHEWGGEKFRNYSRIVTSLFSVKHEVFLQCLAATGGLLTCYCAVCTANGYTRSEAVCVVFLQKARNAKRIYAKLVHAKTNCDGYKEEGITFPSRLIQTQLMEQVYGECHINPASLDYIEAHGTGTRVSLLVLGRYIIVYNDELFEELVISCFLSEFIAFCFFSKCVANFELWPVTKYLISNSFFSSGSQTTCNLY
jgi:hypothetical protein